MNHAGLIGISDKRLPLAIPAHSIDKGWAGTRVNSPGPVGCIALIREPLEQSKRVMRIGAFPIYRKKLPRIESALRAATATGKAVGPQRVGCHVKRPQVPLPAIRDASGVFTPAPPMLEPSLGITGPRNVPTARSKLDDAEYRSRLSLATIPMRAKGRSRINEAKGSGVPSLLSKGSTSTGDGLCPERTEHKNTPTLN